MKTDLTDEQRGPLGAAVYRQRCGQQITQADLAERALVSESTVRLIETGGRRRFRGLTIVALSKALFDNPHALDEAAAASAARPSPAEDEDEPEAAAA